VENYWQRNYYKIRKVVYIDKSVGEHTIDLRIEIIGLIIRNNGVEILEKVKVVKGVNDVIWSYQKPAV
jgi:hypothetical protein